MNLILIVNRKGAKAFIKSLDEELNLSAIKKDRQSYYKKMAFNFITYSPINIARDDENNLLSSIYSQSSYPNTSNTLTSTNTSNETNLSIQSEEENQRSNRSHLNQELDNDFEVNNILSVHEDISKYINLALLKANNSSEPSRERIGYDKQPMKHKSIDAILRYVLKHEFLSEISDEIKDIIHLLDVIERKKKVIDTEKNIEIAAIQRGIDDKKNEEIEEYEDIYYDDELWKFNY